MRLVLVRHAIAEDAPPPGGGDDDRVLSEKGRRRFRVAARGLRRLVPPIDRVLTSPLPRAAETARILATAFGLAAEPERCDALAPSGGVGQPLFSALGEAPPDAVVALVGHEPLLSTLAAHLLAPDGTRVEIELKKGAACGIDVAALPPPSGGLLLFLYTPRALRLAGRRR